MGALRHISNRGIPGIPSTLKCGVGVLILSLLIAGVAGADDSSVPDPGPEEPILEAQVSTSPLAAARPMIARPTRTDAPASLARPLTRAAAQKQIEEMTPVDWLSRFGPVTVGRNE